jgi:peptidoglycan hydrolase CwlO-like protein
MLMTPINIAVPESLTKQKRELETTLTTILAEEEKLVTNRKEIQAALAIIASSVAILSGELVPTATRKPMSDDAKKRIAEGLQKAREAKKAAQVVASAPQEPVPAPADAPVADTSPESGSARKGAKE